MGANFWVKSKGSLMIELVIGLGVVTWILGLTLSTSLWMARIPQRYYGFDLYEVLQSARALAIAKDQDVELIIQNKNLMRTQGGESLQVYTLSLPYSLSLNTAKLGFKGNGRSKYAGTLTMSGPEYNTQITVDVGHGKITLK